MLVLSSFYFHFFLSTLKEVFPVDDAKRPAPETVNFSPCRVVSVRAVPAASPNFAPVYCLMTSEVDGFPIQQGIPLIPVGGAVQGAQTSQAVQPAQPVPSASSFAASARSRLSCPCRNRKSRRNGKFPVCCRLSAYLRVCPASTIWWMRFCISCVSPLRRAA